MLKEFINDMKKWYGDDHIYIGHKCIKAFSLLWWIIRTIQCGVICGCLWVFYILMWLVFA